MGWILDEAGNPLAWEPDGPAPGGGGAGPLWDQAKAMVNPPVHGGQAPQLGNLGGGLQDLGNINAGIEAQARAQGGGVSLNPGPANQAPQGGGQANLKEFVDLAAENQGAGGGGGGPRTKQTIRREVNVAPKTPEQLAQMQRFSEQGTENAKAELAGQEQINDAILQRQQSRLDAMEDIKARQDDIQTEYEDRRKTMQGRQKALETRFKESDEAVSSYKIDPGKLWKEKGTLAQVFAAISIGAGQFGASVNGGRNTASDIIDAAISRNISAQQEELQKLKENRSSVRGEVASNLDSLSQLVTEEAAKKSQLYTSIDKMLEMQIGATQDEEQLGNLKAMRADMQQKKVAMQQEAYQNLLGRGVVEQTSVRGGGGGKQKTRAEILREGLNLKKLYQEVEGGGKDEGKKSSYVDGLGDAGSQKAASDMRETLASAAATMPILDQMIAYSTNKKGGIGSRAAANLPFGVGGKLSEDAAIAEALQQDAAVGLAKAKDPGSVVRENEMKMSLKLIPNPLTVGQDSATAKYDAQKRELVRRVRSRASTAGLDPDAAEQLLYDYANGKGAGGQFGFGK